MKAKAWVGIAAASLALGLGSCRSSKQAAQGLSAEEYILQDLQNQQSAAAASTSRAREAIVDEAYAWLGTKYRYGGDSRGGTDCSGLVQQVFRATLGILLPRNSSKQQQACKQIKERQLLPGDLVFFHTGSKKQSVTHVGIYIGKGRMIHASSSKGVIVSALDEPYYRRYFHSAGRVKELDKKR